MSELNGVRFCNHCNQSVPRDEAHLGGLCYKCWSKRRNWWRLFVVGFLAACIGGIVGLKEKNDVQDTTIIKVEQESIERDTQIIEAVAERLEEIYQWGMSVEEKINTLGNLAIMQKQQIAELKHNLEILKSTLSGDSIKSAEKIVAIKTEIDAIKNRIKNIEADVATLHELPISVIEKEIINPTIKVFVREKNLKVGDDDLGTAVIFKREQLINGTYKYYAITDWHLFNDIYGYVENTRPKQPEDKKLNPEFWISHYEGLGTDRADYHVKIEVLHPNKYLKKFSSSQDFAIFTFECIRKWDVAELASDAEIALLRPNDKIFNSSVFPSDRPGLTTGIVSALFSNVYDGTIVAQCSANPGSSGSPVYAIFNGKPKVIGLIQVISVSQVGGNCVLAYCSRLDKVRRLWDLGAPKDIRKLLG